MDNTFFSSIVLDCIATSHSLLAEYISAQLIGSFQTPKGCITPPNCLNAATSTTASLIENHDHLPTMICHRWDMVPLHVP